MAEGPFEGTCISVVEHYAERCWAKEDPRLPNSEGHASTKCVHRRVSALRQRPNSTPFARCHSAENFCAVAANLRHHARRAAWNFSRNQRRKRLAILMHEGAHRCFLRNEARDMALSQWLCAYAIFWRYTRLPAVPPCPSRPYAAGKRRRPRAFGPKGGQASPSTTRC